MEAADYDLWGYLSFGRLFWSGAGLVAADPFSYVPTVTLWVHNEWLTGVLFFPLYDHLGGAGLALVRYAAALAALGFSLAVCRGRGGQPGWWLFTLAITLVFWASILAPVRARVFSLVFFCLFAWLLDRTRKWGWGRTGLVLVPAMALWANLHAGFWLGLVLAGIHVFALAWERKPLRAPLLVLAAMAVATLANPYGPGLWAATLGNAAAPDPHLEEWLSVWGALHTGLEIFSMGFVVFVLMSVAALVRDPERDPRAILILAATALISALHVRFVVFLAVAVTLYLPSSLARAARAGGRSRLPLPVFFVLLVMGAVPLLLLDTQAVQERLAQPESYFMNPFTLYAPSVDQAPFEGFYYPTGAVAFIRERGLGDKLLSEYAWGSWLAWALYPQCKVGMDGRSQTVYPPKVRELYWEFARGMEGWRAYLEAWPPDLVLVRPGSPADRRMETAPDWRPVYQDRGSVLYQQAAQKRDLRRCASPGKVSTYKSTPRPSRLARLAAHVFEQPAH